MQIHIVKSASNDRTWTDRSVTVCAKQVD